MGSATGPLGGRVKPGGVVPGAAWICTAAEAMTVTTVLATRVAISLLGQVGTTATAAPGAEVGQVPTGAAPPARRMGKHPGGGRANGAEQPLMPLVLHVDGAVALLAVDRAALLNLHLPTAGPGGQQTGHSGQPLVGLLVMRRPPSGSATAGRLARTKQSLASSSFRSPVVSSGPSGSSRIIASARWWL